MSLVQFTSPAEYEKWLGNHHHYNEDVDIHVFGVAGPPLESPNNKATWDIDIDIPVGPVILKFSGSIDLASLNCVIRVYVKVPIIPDILLGVLEGNLNTGVSLKVGVAGIISGEITVQIQVIGGRKWVVLKCALIVMGKNFTFETGLFPLP